MRITIDLDDELSEQVVRLVPEREVNRFISDAIANEVCAWERTLSEMRDGYTATRANRDEIAQEWEAIDLEGWPQP